MEFIGRRKQLPVRPAGKPSNDGAGSVCVEESANKNPSERTFFVAQYHVLRQYG